MKTWNSHREMVSEIHKKSIEDLKGLDAGKVNIWHAATGIATEAGELLSSIKAIVIYNKPMDLDNIIEELGDLEFYMEHLRQELMITRNEVIAHNMEKLGKRYKDGYSDKAAQEREDKK